MIAIVDGNSHIIANDVRRFLVTNLQTGLDLLVLASQEAEAIQASQNEWERNGIVFQVGDLLEVRCDGVPKHIVSVFK